MENKKLNLLTKGKISIKNEGIIAKQTPMTLQEARLLRIVIMQISQYDEDLMEYETTIPELAEFLGIKTTQTLYDDMFNICDKLTSQKIAIKKESTKHPWSFQPWMAEASFDGSVIKLALNEKIRPYVMQFNELFTQYEMSDVLHLRSYYALRIYEILKMKYTSCRKKKNSFDFTLEELREMTGTEDKFKQIGIWKLRVIDIAEREINEKTDINITTEMLKRSRKYIGVRFIVKQKRKTEKIKTLDISSVNIISDQIEQADIYKIKEIFDNKFIDCSIKQAEQLFFAYKKEISEQFLDNAYYVLEHRDDVEDPVAYLLKIKDEHIKKNSKKSKSKPRKTKAKNETIEPMSESRKQAYLDMEVELAEDLWPELSVDPEIYE